ncbi:MAG: sulfotransferase [Pseudomonadota bacterium]
MSKQQVLIRAKKKHALACVRSNRLPDALVLYQKICEQDPQDAEAWFMFGTVSGRLGDLGAAETALRHTLRLFPEFAQAQLNLGHVLELQNKFTAAEACYQRAVAIKPDSADSHESCGRICEQRGDIPAALQYYQHALTLYPARAAARRMAIHFRLAAFYDEAGEYDQAYVQLRQGYQCRPGNFDRAAWARRIDDIMRTFSGEAIARAPRAGNCSERPLLVVGLPWAGAARVAQLLTAHPAVADGGASTLLADLALACEMSCATIPGGAGITGLKREQCDELAQPYLDELARIAPAASRVIDGAPDNFLHLGLLPLLLPMARVIHCVRDPRDTCLSCYFEDGGAGREYARDLADLGFYYRHYRRLMTHWKQALGVPLLEVHYEDLMRHPERVARELLKFCGLTWDARCLAALHDNAVTGPLADAVHTIGRWQYYRPHLEDLQRALADSGK